MCYFASMGRDTGSKPFISVIIPCHNSERTIGKCLEAATGSDYERFEVIVVDDCSGDGSVEIIGQYPCRLIGFSEHRGASAARNTGAKEARGEVLFFIDSDCVLRENSLRLVAGLYRKHENAVIGGTYTPIPHDSGFFSTFQSIFIHYSETKFPEPDYVATHAMVISRRLFLESGGFDENFMPILEDVEFSHRIRRAGVRLLMAPELQVEHIFNFSLTRSLKNAVRKSRFWTMYSLRNKDLARDSGTASVELKVNTLSWPVCAGFTALYAANGNALFALAAFSVFVANMIVNRDFFRAIFNATGPVYTLKAMIYYVLVYPLAVGAGGLMGALQRR
jgi:glycosyltransferase involved in cell wall biosynthesis